MHADGFVPKERYTAAAFADLELERLWSRVWQVAGREEELARAGRLRRVRDRRRVGARRAERRRRDLHAFHNSCLHRGTRLADGRGYVRRRVHPVSVPRLAVRARRSLTRVVDREDFTNLPDDLALRAVPRRRRSADSCSSTSILTPNRCSSSSTRSRRCSRRTTSIACACARYRTTIIDANWKAVVDAFNEGYHVQGLHPQILPWTDDVSIAYEQFGTHAHYGRLAGCAPRAAAEPAARARPRTTTTKARSSPGSSPGSAARSSATSAPRSTSCATIGPPEGSTLLEAYQQTPTASCSRARGVDTSGLQPRIR